MWGFGWDFAPFWGIGFLWEKGRKVEEEMCPSHLSFRGFSATSSRNSNSNWPKQEGILFSHLTGSGEVREFAELLSWICPYPQGSWFSASVMCSLQDGCFPTDWLLVSNGSWVAGFSSLGSTMRGRKERHASCLGKETAPLPPAECSSRKNYIMQ